MEISDVFSMTTLHCLYHSKHSNSISHDNVKKSKRKWDSAQIVQDLRMIDYLLTKFLQWRF